MTALIAVDNFLASPAFLFAIILLAIVPILRSRKYGA